MLSGRRANRLGHDVGRNRAEPVDVRLHHARRECNRKITVEARVRRTQGP